MCLRENIMRITDTRLVVKKTISTRYTYLRNIVLLGGLSLFGSMTFADPGGTSGGVCMVDRYNGDTPFLGALGELVAAQAEQGDLDADPDQQNVQDGVVRLVLLERAA